MLKGYFDLNKLKIYDSKMLSKVDRESLLKKNHLHFLDLALKNYEVYIKFTEEYLDNEAEKFQQKHIESLKNENRKLREYYANRMLEIDLDFTQKYRESIIVQLYSFFERSLIASCEMYYFNKEMEDNDDLERRNSDFDFIKSFLKNIAGIKLETINSELDFFGKLRVLRNRLIHHDTVMFSDDETRINEIRALSNNRFQLIEKKDFIKTYSIHFDNPKFALEIIHKIKTLYSKLGENGFYY